MSYDPQSGLLKAAMGRHHQWPVLKSIMKLPIEIWFEAGDAPARARTAFEEAATAYKGGAYRAALLFSYIGMNLWLKNRLLLAAIPPGMSDGEWMAHLRKLRSDDDWDEEVFNLTQSKDKKAVFQVEDHLRDEVKYWKNRRNDCAHFKESFVEAAHVECFWLFLRSKLGQLVPNGSKAAFLNKVQRHFDPDFTAPGEDILPLIKTLRTFVPSASIPLPFFQELSEALSHGTRNLTIVRIDREAEFFDAIVRLNDAALTNAAIDWLCRDANDQLLAEVVRICPSHVQLLADQPATLRRLWRKVAGIHMLAALLRNDMIPSTEVPEAVAKVASRQHGECPNDSESATLDKAGLYEELRRLILKDSMLCSFAWANANARLLVWWLACTPIETEVAKAFCAAFGSEYFPRGLLEPLRQLFAEQPIKWMEFAAAAKAAGVDVPVMLKPLQAAMPDDST